MVETPPLALLEGLGIELEYMIVDAQTLDVRPIADALIEALHGEIVNEIERGAFAWSNELARHVIEVKTLDPVADFAGLASGFHAELQAIQAGLARFGARLLPSAMHPWMDPTQEFQTWPHGQREIYETFDRIFDCRGHGWANLQSMHLNLSFGSDEEFGRLHAAARALLPLLPALAASSPFVQGRATGLVDSRLDVYRSNSARVPSVAGAVVPEPVFTRRDYETLLSGIYRDLAGADPAGVLAHEWVNGRGCIARFERMALEIRVIDVQECPRADIAIAAAATAVLRALCDRAPQHQARLRALDTRELVGVLRATTCAGDEALIDSRALLRALGVSDEPRRAGTLWQELVERQLPPEQVREHAAALDVILGMGPLARRLRSRVREAAPDRAALQALYTELADGLRDARLLGESRC